VYAVAQPDHGRQVAYQLACFGLRSTARIRQPFSSRPESLKAARCFSRNPRRRNQLAAFPGLAIFEDLDALRRRCRECIEILQDLGVAGEMRSPASCPRTDFSVGNRGIVGSARPEVDLRFGVGVRSYRKQECSESHKGQDSGCEV